MKTLPFLFFAASAIASFAQEVVTVQIRTLCFERVAGGTDLLAVIKPDMSAIEMKFPESFPSARTRVPLIDGKVVFKDPKNLTGPAVAVATIPGGLKDALVMCFPAPVVEGEPAYKTVVIDASPKGIPEDGAFVMNLYPKEIRVVVGEHRILLKAGKSTGLARPRQRNDYNMAPVVFQAKEGTEWRTVSETLVRFPPEQQQFFVSYPDSKNNKLRFRSYQLDNF